MMRNPYRDLERKIGYRFRRRAWLEAALTHPSWRHERGPQGEEADNQRLEFLGDAALGLVTAAALFERFPEVAEGELTRLRAHLVGTRYLAERAADLGLGEWLRLGKGEENSGGRERESNLADALEGLVGAAWCDGGQRAVDRIFEVIFRPGLEALAENEPEPAHTNAKGALQESLQARGLPPPEYEIVESRGPDHDREYEAVARLGEQELGRGAGRSKRAAEAAAAVNALCELDEGSVPGEVE